MSKTLVLAEKPSVGREIARVLGCKRTVEGGLEGERYVVTWALGHLFIGRNAYGDTAMADLRVGSQVLQARENLSHACLVIGS